MKYALAAIAAAIVAIATLFVFSVFLSRIEGLAQTTGVFLRKQGPYEVSLEVAETPREIERGLMYRTQLPPHTGMLFLFPNEIERSFWMRNTLIPLDILFINAAGNIVHIEHSAAPKTETLRSSKAKYVVELPGGAARTQNIQIGDGFRYGRKGGVSPLSV